MKSLLSTLIVGIGIIASSCAGNALNLPENRVGMKMGIVKGYNAICFHYDNDGDRLSDYFECWNYTVDKGKVHFGKIIYSGKPHENKTPHKKKMNYNGKYKRT